MLGDGGLGERNRLELLCKLLLLCSFLLKVADSLFPSRGQIKCAQWWIRDDFIVDQLYTLLFLCVLECVPQFTGLLYRQFFQ